MRKHFIVGTAGHVDHGKSSLIRALTGIETDRLPEEKARGLSIDLGFAHLGLPGDVWAGIVDVPGHERFLKNMLAGVGGFDCALLVVDAQEGVMPQTREHVEILELLRTPRGVVALTKADLVDADFLELVQDDLREFLDSTFLAEARIVPVSSKTGLGVPELKEELARLLGSAQVRERQGQVRLPIDRAFSRPGFGTVVTGSLWSGTISRGDRLVLLPGQQEAKVRGLQVHGKDADNVVAGQRVAVNLSNVDLDEVKRGMLLATPDWLSLTDRIDVRLQIPRRVPRPVRHRARVRVYHATTEVFARVLLLEGDEVGPGESCLAQLLCEQPLALIAADRLVLRDWTSSFTVGGAEVLEPLASVHRRKDEAVLEALQRKESGDLAQRVLTELSGTTPKPLTQLAQKLQMTPAELEPTLQRLADERLVVRLARGWAERSSFDDTAEQILNMLAALQQKAPWKAGWRKEEVLKLLGHKVPRWAEDVLGQLVSSGEIRETQRLMCLPGHVPGLSVAQEQIAGRVRNRLRQERFSPSSWEELPALEHVEPAHWKPVETHLLETGQVVKIGPGFVLLSETLDEARQLLSQLAEPFTAAQARDALQSTRKYMIPLLEYLDSSGFTLRNGELRTVRRQVQV